jgi:ankyrin repeat protein
MTETRPPQNKFQPRISAPVNPFFNRISNPIQKVDDNLIEQLFLLASEGDIIKIKQFVLTNHVSLVVKRENGQNILHVILDNANITDNNKLELVKFAVEYGANVNGFMTGNITPLHLAAKYQLPKICEYLIEKGASVTNVDSQQKTPLFYAVSGTSTECLPEPEIKPLIPESKNNFEKKSLTHAIYKELVQEVINTPTLNQHFTAIKNTLINVTNSEIRYESLTEIDKTISDVSLISVNRKLDEETRKSQITDKIRSVKKTVTELLKSKLKTSITEMEIHPNTENGWGPDGGTENKILPYNEIKNITDNIELDINKNIETSLENINKELQNYRDNIGSLRAIVREINVLAVQLLMFNLVLSKNGSNKIDDKILRNIYYYKGLDVEIINIDNPDKYTIDDRYSFKILFDTSDKVIETPYLTKKEIEKLNKTIKSTVTKTYLNDKMKVTFDSNVKRTDPKNIKLPTGTEIYDETNLNSPNYTNSLYKESWLEDSSSKKDELYFIVRSLYYIIHLDDEMENISNNIANLGQTIRQSQPDYNKFYTDDLKNIINSLLSYINGLILIKKELNICNDRFILLKQEFLTVKDEFFLFDIIIEDHIDPLLNKFSNGTVNNSLDIIYNSIINLFNNLNIIIQNVNKKNSEELIKSYVNVTTFDNNTSDTNFQFTEKLYDRPFRLIDSLPSSLDEISKKTNNVKKYLIEHFALSINRYNFMNFYDSTTDEKPKIGYLTDFTNINTSSKLEIKYGSDGITNILDGNPTFYDGGKTGQISTVDIPKTKGLVPAVYQSLDDFFNIIKYILIRYIIATEKTKTDADKKYNKITNELKKILGFEPQMSLIYSFVGKIVDGIMIDYIKQSINSVGNIFISQVFEKYEKLIKLSELIDTTLISKDIGFTTGLNDFFDEYAKNKDLIITNLIDEEYKTKKNSKNHKLVNYSYDNRSSTAVCFNIDIDTAEILLKKSYINQTDILGNTPLFYAIELQHEDLIKLLKKYNAGTEFKNKSGETIISILWKNYKQNIIDYMMNTKDLAKISTEKIVDELNKKVKYGHNVIKYVENIIPFMFYLINHQIFMSCKRYPLDWTYDKNETLMKKLGLDSKKYFPFYKFAESNGDISIDTKENEEVYNEYQTKIIKKYTLEKKSLEKKKKEYENENTKLGTPIAETLEEKRKTINTEKITKIDGRIKVIDAELKTLNFNITDTTTIKFKDIDLTKNKSNALSLYEQFNDIITNQSSKNLTIYPKLIEEYLKNPQSELDNVQILNKLFNYQKDINTKTDKENLEELKEFNDFYKNILEPFGKNYFDLAQEINGVNYPLTYIINIISHVIKHFILATFYRTIVKLIQKQEIETGIKTVFKEDDKLFEYIIKTIPIKIVKITLQIFDEYENDYDRNLSIEQIFEEINQLLKTNSNLVNITEESSLIKNLNEYIYPFFKDWLELFIREMKSVSDVYIRNILYQSKYINIISIICK